MLNSTSLWRPGRFREQTGSSWAGAGGSRNPYLLSPLAKEKQTLAFKCFNSLCPHPSRPDFSRSKECAV